MDKLKSTGSRPADFDTPQQNLAKSPASPDAPKSDSPAAGVDSSSVSVTTNAWGVKLKKAARPADCKFRSQQGACQTLVLTSLSHASSSIDDGTQPNVPVKSDIPTAELTSVKLRAASPVKSPGVSSPDLEEEMQQGQGFAAPKLKKVADNAVEKEIKMAAARDAEMSGGKSAGFAMA